MIQDVTLRTKDGAESKGRGELRVYGSTRRVVLTALYAIFGLVFGLPTLLPGPHMCVTWIFPVAGTFLAVRTWITAAELSSLEGTCPACQAPIELSGGSLDADGALKGQMCLGCRTFFEVQAQLPEASA